MAAMVTVEGMLEEPDYRDLARAQLLADIAGGVLHDPETRDFLLEMAKPDDEFVAEFMRVLASSPFAP